MTNLKPCPFCGDEAVAYGFHDPMCDNEMRHGVECVGCAADINVLDTEEAAVTFWNTRYKEVE